MKIDWSVKISLLDRLFLSAISLNFFSYFLFEKTLVELWTILGLFAIGAIIYYPIRKIALLKHVGIIESMFYSIIICGSILTFSFLSLNYIFSSNHTQVSSYKVKCKVQKLFPIEQQNKRAFLIKAEFNNGFYKRISLSKEFSEHTNHPDSLDFHLTPGLFGYQIIKKIELKKAS